MKPPNDAAKIFKDWLESDDCHLTLKRWAASLIKKTIRLNLPKNIWPYSKEDIEDVVNDFWFFLKNYPEKQFPQLESFIKKGNITKTLSLASQTYIQTKKAEARKEGWRYLYRRIRETLKEDQGVHYLSDKKGCYYSLKSEASLLNDFQVLHSEPYSRWKSPLNIISERQFSRFKGTDFLKLSIFFWKEAFSKLKVPYFLPVREVVNFLTAHYQTIAPIETVSYENLCHEDDNEAGESKIPSSIQFESNILEATLEPLAENLIESWPYERKVCFALKYENPAVSFREMAEKLGLKRHSNAQYHYETAISELRDFCSVWPGPTLPDVERNLFFEFINKVAELCKKSFNGHKQ